MPTKKQDEQPKNTEAVVQKKENITKNKPAYIKIVKILRRPMVTEKSALHEKDNNEYMFRVDLKATKPEVRRAIKELYGVDVESVNTIIRKGKKIRFGKIEGQRSDEKIAIIKLKAGQSINIYK
ncbi:50S ribosomal protein L23 [Patescibacteria group bacterium]|nr:50S ribosomal protein L23 [Patescibacteria group bacterium]